MINVIIYLNENHDAKALVKDLLAERLIAKATVDFQNVSHVIENDEIKERIYNVITVQTKSLLFKEICNIVEERYGTQTLINALPIIGSNNYFNEVIANNTIKV